MITSSPALTSRGWKTPTQREQALGDAIAAETGTDTPQQRLAAALLASGARVPDAEASLRSAAGQSREEIRAVLADAATATFDLLEPSLGGYLIRAADRTRTGGRLAANITERGPHADWARDAAGPSLASPNERGDAVITMR